MFGRPPETRSPREQARSGLRLGIGAASLFVGGMLLIAGLSSVVWAVGPGRNVSWSDPIGWFEVIAGIAILIPSAGLWWQLFAGYMLFAALKSLLLLVTGRDLYAPHDAVSRLTATLLAGYAMATLVLLARFIKNPPSIIDRFALALFLVALLWRADTAKFSDLAPGLIAGPLLLLAAQWLNSLVRHRNDHRKCGVA